jgi:hypothetical protein
MIVFDDADVASALPVGKALTVFSGQFCIFGALRLLRVQDGVYGSRSVQKNSQNSW